MLKDKIYQHLRDVQEDYLDGGPLPFDDIRHAIKNLSTVTGSTPYEVRHALCSETIKQIISLLTDEGIKADHAASSWQEPVGG